jgi:hypothetical protein
LKGFLFGNGPSMKWQCFADTKEQRERFQPFAEEPDLNKRLKGEITIGVNFICRIFEPDHLLWTDNLAFAGYGDVENAKSQRWVWDHQKSHPCELEARRFSFYSTKEDILLSEYIEDGLHRNGSCVYSAINLAYILGISPLFLVGCDWSERDSYTHFYSEKPESQTFLESRAPRDRGSLAYVERLGENINEFPGFEIYNATEGGVLQNFPTCTLAEALDMPDEIGDDILYTPDYSHLTAEIEQMRRIHEANKRALRLEVIDLWRKKKGTPARTT